MQSHDVKAVLGSLQTRQIRPGMHEDENAPSAIKFLETFNQCMLGITRFSGQTPWERHPDGDELLYIMEGGVELTILDDTGETRVRIPCGSIAVVPRGLWHRQRAESPTALLFATAAVSTQHSWAEDPRTS